MTAYRQAYGEHHTHEVVLFAEVVLVMVPKPTHRGLQGGKRWPKGDAVFIKGVWLGRSETSDEHIVLTPGGRVFSRTIRRLEPSRRHDAGFLGKVKRFTVGRTGRYCTGSTEKGTCTTTTRFGWREHPEPQS